MDRGQFLDEVFTFFKTSNEGLKRTYDLALSTRKRIDWDKLYTIVIRDAEKRYLPTPKWFIAKFDNCILVDQQTYKINGGTGILTIRCGKKDYTYEFDMSNCRYSLAEIKARFRAKYKDSFKDFVYYPPNFKCVGQKVIDLNEYDKEEQDSDVG